MTEATRFASLAFSSFQKGCARACSPENCHIVMCQRALMLDSCAFIPCQVSDKAGCKGTDCLPVAKHAVHVEVDRGKLMSSSFIFLANLPHESVIKTKIKRPLFWKTAPEHEPVFAAIMFISVLKRYKLFSLF